MRSETWGYVSEQTNQGRIVAAIFVALAEAGRPLTEDEVMDAITKTRPQFMFNIYVETRYWIRQLAVEQRLIQIGEWTHGKDDYRTVYKIACPLDAMGSVGQI
jgi:hypothetical protein